MTKSTITREWLQQTIAELESVRDEIPFGIDTNSELELAAFKLALAAMDSEPVAYAWVSRSGKKHLTRCEPEQWRDAVILTPLYRHAQPAPELAAIVERLNLSGYEYEGGEVTPQNAAAIVDTLLQQLDDEVQGRNAQPAPVTEREPIAWLNDAYLARGVVDGEAGSEDAGPGYIPVYREAQSAPVAPEIDRKAIADKVYGMCCRIPGATFYNAAEFAIDEVEACRAAMLQSEPVTTTNKLPPNSFTDDELEGMAHGNNPQSNAYRELLAYRRNSPVIPDTWIPVSERLPEEGGRYWCYVEEQNSLGKSHYQWNCSWNGEIWGGAMMYGRVTHWMPLPAAPQEVQGE